MRSLLMPRPIRRRVAMLSSIAASCREVNVIRLDIISSLIAMDSNLNLDLDAYSVAELRDLLSVKEGDGEDKIRSARDAIRGQLAEDGAMLPFERKPSFTLELPDL